LKLVNPYRDHGIWLRGSFHNHTSNSDGHHPLSTVYRMYQDYDLFAISDHDLVTAHTGESRIPTLFEAVEVSSPQCHMLLVHLPDDLMDDYSPEFTIDNYEYLSAKCVDHGGFSVLVHPNRYYSQYWKLEDMLALKSYTGIEVINGDGFPQFDIAFDKWDEVLSHGRRVWGFGNDDFHAYGQERRAWNMVLAAENSKEAVLTAVRQGSFYVSTGFDFESIRTEGSTIHIHLRSGEHWDRMYKYVTLIGKNGEVLHEKTGRFSELDYTCRGDEGYVRIAAYLEGGFGAFSQPIFIEQGDSGHVG